MNCTGISGAICILSWLVCMPLIVKQLKREINKNKSKEIRYYRISNIKGKLNTNPHKSIHFAIYNLFSVLPVFVSFSFDVFCFQFFYSDAFFSFCICSVHFPSSTYYYFYYCDYYYILYVSPHVQKYCNLVFCMQKSYIWSAASLYEEVRMNMVQKLRTPTKRTFRKIFF